VKSTAGDAREVLVRGPNWVGDLVMSTPALRALRAGLPDARITVQVRPGLEPLLAGAPFVDRVATVESYHAGPRALWREGQRLRRAGGFDLGICIPDSISSALLMRLAGVRCVVGYQGPGRGALLHMPVPVPGSWGKQRMVARERFALGLALALGIESRGTQLELHVSAQEEAAAEAAIEWDDRPCVGLAPGAAFGSAKRWPVQSFAEVGDRLAAAGARVLLLGAPGEAELTAAVAAAMRAPASNLAGALDLGGSKALIRRLSLLIGNDAGARHIAVALGVPCIVFFGPTSVDKTNLNLEHVTVMQTDDPCRPCYLRECPIDHPCMRGIASADVIRHALDQLAAPPLRIVDAEG
jgi:heptosyltransferase-2